MAARRNNPSVELDYQQLRALPRETFEVKGHMTLMGYNQVCRHLIKCGIMNLAARINQDKKFAQLMKDTVGVSRRTIYNIKKEAENFIEPTSVSAQRIEVFRRLLQYYGQYNIVLALPITTRDEAYGRNWNVLDNKFKDKDNDKRKA